MGEVDEKLPTGKELAEMAKNSKSGIKGYSEWKLPAGLTMEAGEIFVGKGYKLEMGNGKLFYISRDGKLRFRMMNKVKNRDYEANFEIFFQSIKVDDKQKPLSNYHIVIFED